MCTKILSSNRENQITSVPTSTPISNHLPTTIQQLLKSIGKRLLELSCNKKTFKKAIPPYHDVLKKVGFQENLVNTPKITSNYNLYSKQRKGKIK